MSSSSARDPQATPGVSVIITVLNAQPFLEEAVASVLDQQAPTSSEILLVDDGSTDGSFDLARRLAVRHPSRIRLLHHPGRRNCGISASRNLALRHARAPILAMLDADDVWLPHRLASQLPLLHAHPEVALVYAQAERWLDFHLPCDPAVGSLGRNFTPPLIPVGAAPGLVPSPRLLDWFLADESMTPCTCTVLVRTAVARRVGGFVREFTGLYDDQVFYSKLALSHPAWVSLETVARYRQHPSSCCAVARHAPAQAQAARDHFLRWLHRYSGAQARSLRPQLLPQLA